MNPHYTKLAESIIQFALSRSKAASELMHSGLRGRAREIFAKDLLTPFLSPNVGACTGIVVDSNGGSSHQIDIIIYDKTLIPSLMFTGEEGIVPIHNVYCARCTHARIMGANQKIAGVHIGMAQNQLQGAGLERSRERFRTGDKTADLPSPGA